MIARSLYFAVAGLLLAALPGVAAGGTVRVATFDVGLARNGPGLLLGELRERPGDQVAAIVAVIQAVRPDVLLLTGIDDDRQGAALDALRALLRAGPGGVDYPEAFRAPVNAGEPSGRDLDGDGRRMGFGDAWGWGRFPGNGGMALLSRLPADRPSFRSFRRVAWAALPGAALPERAGGSPFPDATTRDALRLASRSIWDLLLTLPDGRRLHLMAANPTPPLYDRAEAFNRRRNRDEIRFLDAYLGGGRFPDDAGSDAPVANGSFVVAGNLNVDPAGGAGLKDGIAGLLANPRLRDPRPSSAAGGTATAAWAGAEAPRRMRVDYVLPSSDLSVAGAGVFWPAPGEPGAEAAAAASAHRLVWLDLVVATP